jgi:hypothetical protein
VFASNGTKSDLCFARRKHPETPIQARINVNTLSASLMAATFSDKWLAESPPAFTTEELMLFETNSTHAQANLERSAVAWGKVMRAWGVTPNPNVIEAVLRPDWGKRSPPAAHSQTIFNARKVYDALHSDRKLAKYKWMWRGDTPDPPDTTPTKTILAW